MTSVEIVEAKSRLTQLLAKVAKGEKILITNRGQSVAMLVPPEPDSRTFRRPSRKCLLPETRTV